VSKELKHEFHNLPIQIDQNRFIERLNTKIVEIIGRKWDFWYGLTLRYLVNINKSYRPFWSFQIANPNVPSSYKTSEGHQLGAWQSSQRVNYKKGKLSPDQIKRLENIGFAWPEKTEEPFEKGFRETLRYKYSTGDPNAPANYKTAEGYRLGSWQHNQKSKKGILSPDKIKRLEDLGFIWDRLEEQFEKGLQESLLYKASTGNSNTPPSYKTAEGFQLGYWQSNQRNKYKKGTISPYRIKRLEEIGFTLENYEEQFEEGFTETLLYKESTGNPNAPANYKTDGGFLLGIWQSNQRKSYREGEISPDRIRRLKEIGFIWEKLEEQFEEGFTETLHYKESTGNPNAPESYKTAEGYHLGTWQNTQKGKYKKGKLSPYRIKRLEDIGFKWEIEA
jgi:hypothetical protein